MYACMALTKSMKINGKGCFFIDMYIFSGCHIFMMFVNGYCYFFASEHFLLRGELIRF